jgi:hypothetical protein
MNYKYFFVFFVFLVSCSDAPSESEITTVLQNTVREGINQQISAMAFFGGEKVAKKFGIPDPETISINSLDIESQIKKENGDYLTKVRYDLKSGDNIEKNTARITTTLIDGKLKIIDVEKL